MNVDYIKNLLLDLYYDLPEEVHTRAIEELANIDEEYLPMLLQPIDKSYWDYAAITLKKIGYPKYKKILPGLLEWLQDINWPGTLTITESLAEIDEKILIPYIEEAVSKAIEDNDPVWLFGITFLTERLNISRDDFNNKELYDKLKCVHNYHRNDPYLI